MSANENKSTRPGVPWLLVLLTLLGGAFVVQRGKAPFEDKAETPLTRADSAEKPSSADDRLLAPLREFLALPVQTAESESKGDREAALKKRIRKQVGLLEFLIVMVADPIETATNYRFDLQLDTLHKALGVEGYVPDHYYLPWADSPKLNAHRSEPGVLLYRRTGDSRCDCPDSGARTDLLVVYLVGETPTSGIHKDAFLASVKQLELLGPMACLPEPSPPAEHLPDPAIRVAGPLFTGGADSLAIAIRQARDEQLARAKFQVITGTAVSIDLDRFQDLAGKGNADLHSTVLYGSILRQALIDHVIERTWAKKVRIAWLTETGTAYGSRSSVKEGGREDDVNHKSQSAKEVEETKDIKKDPWYQRLRQDQLPNMQQMNQMNQMAQVEPPESLAPAETPKTPSPPPLEVKSLAATSVANPKRAEIIEFRFPVNISKVRSGYAEMRRKERMAQAALGPESSRLPIPFDDTSTARDVPPMQTPKVTAPTVELLLAQILTTIRTEGIKHVGISSSDPRDPIFLAELIKEQAPDVQIMLVTSDVLHMHSEYRSIMHGTLVSSTHPLHPEAQDWCFPFGEDNKGNLRSAVLSSQSNYGLYNAVLFLRGLQRGQYVHEHLAGGGDGEERDSNLIVLKHFDKYQWPATGLPIGYSMPFQKRTSGSGTILRPAVWISRISPTGISPITVRPTNTKFNADYTINLQIATPPDKADPLPAFRIRSQIPTSLYICSLLWLVAAVVYLGAVLIPKPVGNWAKALQWVRGDLREFQGLVYVFRTYITGSFIYVLIMFGQLMYVHSRWIGTPDNWTVFQYRANWVVAMILFGFLVWDWCWAWWGVGRDVFAALRDIPRSLTNEAAIAWRKELWRRIGKAWKRTRRWAARWGKGPNLRNSWTWVLAHVRTLLKRDNQPDLNWHLISARVAGLVLILVLVTIHVWASVWQRLDWLDHVEDTFLWFKMTSDMWNGLSPAMTAQLLSIGLIVLVYGMMLQMHLLSEEYTIIRPTPAGSTAPSDDDQKKGRLEVQSALLFPLLSRWRRDRPVVLDLVLAAATLGWLAFLGCHLQSPDYCAMPVSFPMVLLLSTGAFWSLRLFKLVAILKGLAKHLDELTRDLRMRWPETWPKMFELLPEKRYGLQELFWCSRPTTRDPHRDKAKKALQEEMSDYNRRKAEQRLCAIEIDLYIRQFFHHIVRLGLGLVISACLLFLCAQAFPYSQEPLVRLSASVMLAAIGCVMTWYYLKFDRNELLSHLVGTDPKQISINWSLIQMVAPAVLLTLVALLSHTFPEIWQWVRGVLEPVARSSI